MLRLNGLFLLAVIVLPYLSYARQGTGADHDSEAVAGSVCMRNLHAGIPCDPDTDRQQAMVLVRGQLLPVR